ncbi:unnamed protein product [Ranitomeya imitator]|uniref:Ig-like domain-containing protein n=1 Tax=Ranitomeya imitator TaxID=111125 RepID=A0ABN9L1Q6_9NEOB|nr:unnamed protein product [Ranitomeya imitator]
MDDPGCCIKDGLERGKSKCLEVTTSPPQPLVLVDGDILLHCHFTFLEPIRAEDVAVKWTVKSSGDAVRPVYTFDGVRINSLRPESSIDHRLLETGNASLYLPNLTLEDEGEYTCTVLISPEVGEASLVLRLAAQPTIGLLPVDPRVTSGEMKTFICKISHFYPQDLDIKWIMKKEKRETVLTKDICSGVPFQGKNGTFSADSQVSILFTEEDDGSVIGCEVRHQSLPRPLRIDTAIHLTVVQVSGRVALLVSAILLMMALIVASVILYWKFLASVTPEVSAIILPELILADERMEAICNINGFRPKAVNICWYIEKSDQGVGSGLGKDEPLLQAATALTSHARHPEVSKHGSLFNATSKLSYTPSRHALVCVVQHKALGAAARRVSHVSVAARPKKSYITSWPQDPRRGDKLTLSCIVERFYPKPIVVTWLRNGQIHSGAAQFGPFPCENDYYSVWSQIDLIVTEEEDGVMYTCRISHRSLSGVEELSYEINAQGTPPGVQFISADPVTPTIGQELLLSCSISNFFPRDIVVDWSKDGIKLDAGACEFLCVTNTSGVHSMWSFLRFTPAAEDDGCVFTCSVQHTALRHREERTYTLSLPAENHGV